MKYAREAMSIAGGQKKKQEREREQEALNNRRARVRCFGGRRFIVDPEATRTAAGRGARLRDLSRLRG
jgi:1-acyl-sn-glycerol-3-phosphate acyltransferase